MAYVIMRVMHDPTNTYTFLDEFVVCRGNSETCAKYLRELDARAERRGFRRASGFLMDGRTLFFEFRLQPIL